VELWPVIAPLVVVVVAQGLMGVTCGGVIAFGLAAAAVLRVTLALVLTPLHCKASAALGVGVAGLLLVQPHVVVLHMAVVVMV
jgi:hypothetical protein